MILLDVNNREVSREEIELVISKIICEIIAERRPYVYVSGEEPFINKYTGNISYDYSGDVRKMKEEDLKELIEKLDQRIYSSLLDQLLEGTYINSWRASYISNYGKFWYSYKDLAREAFDEYKYETFEMYNEEDDDIDEDKDIALDEIFEDFIEKTDYKIYLKRLRNRIKELEE